MGGWAGATNPQVWPAGEQTLERALRGEAIDNFDICLRRHDGREPRWVTSSPGRCRCPRD